MRGTILLAVVAALNVACSRTLVSDVDESDANRIIHRLQERGLAAEKVSLADGRWGVSVPASDASAALGVLVRESLDVSNGPGVLDALGDGGLVPSRTAERARLLAGTAGDLERTLRRVDGVLDARVHLALPAELGPRSPAAPTGVAAASVLIRHRGSAPPLAASEVQALVAGAVDGLARDAVEVVQTAIPEAPSPAPEWTTLGPLTVARSSAGLARGLAVALAVLQIALTAVVVLLWRRLRTRTVGDSPDRRDDRRSGGRLASTSAPT